MDNESGGTDYIKRYVQTTGGLERRGRSTAVGVTSLERLTHFFDCSPRKVIFRMSSLNWDSGRTRVLVLLLVRPGNGVIL